MSFILFKVILVQRRITADYSRTRL